MPKEDKNQSWVFGELKAYEFRTNLSWQYTTIQAFFRKKKKIHHYSLLIIRHNLEYMQNSDQDGIHQFKYTFFFDQTFHWNLKGAYIRVFSISWRLLDKTNKAFFASLSAGSLQDRAIKRKEIEVKDALNTQKSWSNPRSDFTVVVPVIASIRHLASEQQMTSLIPEEMAFKRPAFIANASATKAEAM